MNKSIERQITKIYNSVFKKVFTQTIVRELQKGDKDAFIEKITKIENSKVYDKFCKDFSIKLAKKGLAQERGLWRKYFKASKKAGLIAIDYTYKEYELKLFEKAVKHNFKMIKSIPQEVFKTFKEKAVQNVLNNVVRGSVGRRTFELALAEHGAKKAKVIARTETAKLQSAITEYRATSLGSVAYFWRASKDRRTRPSHKEMEYVIVFYRGQEQKPLRDGMRGNAGEFPNCRCNMTPIFSSRDLPKNTYKVYDYRTDKIEVMPKKMVLDYLINGSLD